MCKPALGIEQVRMSGDVAKQPQRMGGKAGLTLSGFKRTLAQAQCIVEPSKQQTGTTHRVVAPGAMTDNSSLQLTLEKLLTLPQPPRGLVCLAELRQRPRVG